jgi:hypothetical protein
METTTTPEPKTDQTNKEKAPVESPQDFYARITKRPDIRRILTKLANLDEKKDEAQ